MMSSERALIQYDLCLYKRGKLRHRESHAQKTDTQREAVGRQAESRECQGLLATPGAQKRQGRSLARVSEL